MLRSKRYSNDRSTSLLLATSRVSCKVTPMASIASSTRPHVKRVRLLHWFLLLVVLAFVLMVVPVRSSSHYTCLYCRADNHQRRILGIPWTSVSDTALTPWFRTHHPDHEHTWVWAGSTLLHTCYGSIIRACGERHPIYRLSPSSQLVLAQRAPFELEALYRAFDSPDKSQRVEAALSASIRAIELQ